MEVNLMKKTIAFILMVMIILVSTASFAEFNDVPQNASYKEALDRLQSLGIIQGNDKNMFNPDDFVTREQFAKMIVVAAGLEDTAATLKGSTVFPDISSNRWSTGYINTAVDKGYITGAPDGKFHPEDYITFAQACTIFVKALGYTDQDVTGLWPRNYIEKAGSLGLTDGISLGNNDPVSRWAAVIMIDRLLSASMKSDPDKTLLSTSGTYTQCIILGDPRTSSALTGKQIMTDKGVYYNNSGINLELGNTYNLVIKNDTITKVSGKIKSVLNIAVDNAVDTSITYIDGNEETKNISLPQKTVYYYHGEVQKYESIKDIFQKNSSIVLAYNNSKTGYVYAVIFDPVYSKPEIAINFVPSSKKLGEISFRDNPQIIRDGVLIDISAIEEREVVYEVSDIWNKNRFIYVIDERVGGKITGFLPNKISPKSLQIDGVEYHLSRDMELSKINTSISSFDIDDNIIAYLGYDGKIVDIEYPGSESNSDYAFVINTGSITQKDSNGKKSTTYTVKLLLTDGTVAILNTKSNAYAYKGRLVKYTKEDNNTVSLNYVLYNSPGSVNIDKEERTLGSSYVADNVKIFNVVSDDSDKDTQVNLLDWKDMPGDIIPKNKIFYTNKVGAFEDINIILTNDILEEKYKYGIIKSGKTFQGSNGSYSYAYTLLVDGKEYTYSDHIKDGYTGNVVKVKMDADGVESVIAKIYADYSSEYVQAFDTRRIKIKDQVYKFKNNLSVYCEDTDGNVTVGSIGDIKTNYLYSSVYLYMDKSPDYGGKVEVIVLSE